MSNTLLMSDEEFSRHMESQEEETVVIEDTTTSQVENTETQPMVENDDSTPENVEVEVTGEEGTQSQEVETVEKSTEDTEVPSTETTEIDYKAFYDTVTQDYKAAGKNLPGVKDPEKFIKALQMSTDYALKTSALKPALKRVKMLEGITDEELSEMLDFKKRDPEVIKKALKEIDINPIDLDLEDINYVPQSKMMSDSEYEFQEALAEIKDDPEFSITSKIILEEFDAVSKQAALDDPRVLRALHWEVRTGRYKTIQEKVLQKKALGEANGRTDLDLFVEVATEIDRQPKGVSSQEKKEDPALIAKRQQAGISTKKTINPVKKYDPTRLSDEEFMKLLDDGASFI